MYKKTKHEILLLSIVLLIIILIVPTVLVLPFRSDASIAPTTYLQELLQKKPQEKQEDEIVTSNNLSVEVFRTNHNTIEKLDLEEYVFGVVAGEMPANFHKEALKSQAVAARSYIYKKMLEKSGSIVTITDTTNDQVYKSEEELKNIWKDNYQKNRTKIVEAVNETRGKILLYNKKPVSVAYFSTSNGYTENSNEYWSTQVPFLQSVDSAWDVNSPKFLKEYSFSIQEFSEKLNLPNNPSSVEGKILSKTTGKRVKEVKFGHKTFTGREVRELLHLASTDFTWEVREDSIVFQTKGYGHGVGMSQYGANYMAEDGANYKDILRYYYKGIDVGDIKER